MVSVGQSTTPSSEDTVNTETTVDDYYARSGDMLETTSIDSVASSVGDSSTITTSDVTTSKIATQQSPIVVKEEVHIQTIKMYSLLTKENIFLLYRLHQVQKLLKKLLVTNQLLRMILKKKNL